MSMTNTTTTKHVDFVRDFRSETPEKLEAIGTIVGARLGTLHALESPERKMRSACRSSVRGRVLSLRERAASVKIKWKIKCS